MITTYLMGGAGNQLFQYAMGLATARRLGVELQLETSFWDTTKHRQYNLCLWEGVTEKLVKGIKPTISHFPLAYEQSVVDSIKDGDCLQGNWTTEKYFKSIRQELLMRLVPKQPRSYRAEDLLGMIQEEGSKSAFVTVRRTDYLTSDFGILTSEYYLRACRKIAEHTPNPKFFVFSDDTEWCKSNFELPYRFVIAEGNDQTTADHLGREDEDLWAMSRCQHAIMANSTYSWWGAWLNTVPDNERVVVTPTPWFYPSTLDTRDIVPDRWLKI